MTLLPGRARPWIQTMRAWRHYKFYCIPCPVAMGFATAVGRNLIPAPNGNNSLSPPERGAGPGRGDFNLETINLRMKLLGAPASRRPVGNRRSAAVSAAARPTTPKPVEFRALIWQSWLLRVGHPRSVPFSQHALKLHLAWSAPAVRRAASGLRRGPGR